MFINFHNINDTATTQTQEGRLQRARTERLAPIHATKRWSGGEARWPGAPATANNRRTGRRVTRTRAQGRTVDRLVSIEEQQDRLGRPRTGQVEVDSQTTSESTDGQPRTEASSLRSTYSESKFDTSLGVAG